MNLSKFLFVFLLLPLAAVCQTQTPADIPPVVSRTETILVTGTFEPVPLSESNRSVVSFDTRLDPLLYNVAVDYLQEDPSINLRQRGGDGIQADLSIRGSTFAQSLVLLNGFRINDAQSAHHNLDLPIPLEAISTIEVLHGAGSTLYGADAVGGVVNFIPLKPEASEIRVRTGFGNFGFNQQHLSGAYVGKSWSEVVTGSRDFSTGFMPDRDYRSSSASSETRFTTALGDTDILVAGSDRPFGANQFYGNFNSWERTKGWFASLRQQVGKNTEIEFAYHRHSDVFVLFRDKPAVYENNHISESWQGTIRRQNQIRKMILSYGVDVQADQIDSNNLGIHGRNRGAGYINLDVPVMNRFSVSLGGREEIFSGGRQEFSPTVAGGFHVGGGFKLRASISRAFRLPSYTDLYYQDPANIGNPFLKPESAWSFEGGPQWNPGGRVSAEATLFHRRERNDIDYVKSSLSQPWQAMNVSRLSFTGVEALVRLRLPKAQFFQLGYTVLHGSQPSNPGLISQYVFNYPSHNAVFGWTGHLGNQIGFRNRLTIVQRVGLDAYPLWDLAASRSVGVIRPYVQLTNLSNTGYQEIPFVAMQGRAVVGGVEIVLSGKKDRP